jgi:hypothetical protein
MCKFYKSAKTRITKHKTSDFELKLAKLKDQAAN